MVDYIVNDLGKNRFGVIYQDDAFGRSVLRNCQAALEAHDLPILAKTAHSRNTHAVHAGLLHDGGAILAGLGVFLAIMLHKPLDAYSIIGLVRVSGYGNRACTLTNVGFALLCPLVTVFTFPGVGLLNQLDELHIVGYVMAFAAGVFLCISLSDLLPEIQFHSHDRGILALAFLIGIGLAYALFYFESDTMHGLETIDPQ